MRVRNAIQARHMWALCALVGSTSFLPATGYAQAPITEFLDLKPFYGTSVKVYPTLTPRTFLKVGYGPIDTEIPIGEGRTVRLFQQMDFERRDVWQLTRIRQKPGGTEEKTPLHPERIDLTTATGVAYLYFKQGTFQKDDKIEVGINAQRFAGGQQVTVIHGNMSSPALVSVGSDPEPQSYTLKIDPGQVQDQALLDGTKKNVTHIEVKLDVPTLVESGPHLFLKSDNLFSTESRDKSAAMGLKLGAESSLSKRWYIPWSLEAEVLGNQAFTNASYVLALKAQTIVPWGWVNPPSKQEASLPAPARRGRGSIFYNGLIRAPVSPTIDLGVQYERRFKIDDRAPLSHANENLFRIAGQVAWNPIHLFSGKSFTARDISLEVLAKGWLFPNEKATGGAKVRRREGRFEISLLIPLGGAAAESVIPDVEVKGPVPFIVPDPDGGPIKRIRIKYTDGANEANGFARSSEWTFAVEVVK